MDRVMRIWHNKICVTEVSIVGVCLCRPISCICVCLQMQQQELFQLRQKEANLTALAAIGPRKKRKMEAAAAAAGAEVTWPPLSLKVWLWAVSSCSQITIFSVSFFICLLPSNSPSTLCHFLTFHLKLPLLFSLTVTLPPPSLSQGSGSSPSASGSGSSGASRQFIRQRITRVNLRDLLFCLENERDTSHSHLLYKGFLK